MWRFPAFAGLFASALLGLHGPVAADEAAAWAALRSGGSVALMRHADAPGGAGDPPGFRLDDCSTQRNLSEDGRAEARAAGARIKAEGIAIGRLVSSPWCRCLETARLMELGPVAVEATFSNAFVLSDQRPRLTEGAKALISGWKGPGTLLVVTHGTNIQALTGRNPAQSEIVVVAAGSGDTLPVLGTIPAPAR